MEGIITTLKLFLLFNVFFAIVNSTIYYQVRHIDPTLKNLAIYNGCLLILYWIINIFVTKIFSYGNMQFGQDIWKVNLIYWSTGIFSSVVLTYLWFGKWPTGNNLIGLCFILVGIIIANLP